MLKREGMRDLWVDTDAGSGRSDGGLWRWVVGFDDLKLNKA
jgi:hypothetical protein